MADPGETTSHASSASSHPSLTAIFSPMNEQGASTDGFVAAPVFSSPAQPTPSPQNISPSAPSAASADIPMKDLYIHYKDQAYSVDTPSMRIGRGEQCDLRVHDLQVSTNHCLIQHGILIDTRSTNGTSVNGKILTPHTQHILKNNDLIFIGATELIIGPKDRTAVSPPPPQAAATQSPSQQSRQLDITGLPPPQEPSSPTKASSQPSSQTIPPTTLSPKSSQHTAITPASTATPASTQTQTQTQTQTPFVGNTHTTPSQPNPASPHSLARKNNFGAMNLSQTPSIRANFNTSASSSTSSTDDATSTPGGTGAKWASQTSTPAQAAAASAQGAGIPTTDEILNSAPAQQRTHIEFLRSEIFRHRRSQLMDKKKHGVIGGRTSGHDNSDIFSEVIDLKKQMDNVKFILLYGDENLQQSPPESIRQALNGYSGTPLPTTTENNHDSAQNEALLSKIRSLEQTIASKDVELSTAQANTDVVVMDLKKQHDAELDAKSKHFESQLVQLAEAVKRIEQLEQDLSGAKLAHEADKAKLNKLLNEKQSNQQDDSNTWEDKFNSMTRECASLQTSHQAEVAKLRDQAAQQQSDFDAKIKLMQEQCDATTAANAAKLTAALEDSGDSKNAQLEKNDKTHIDEKTPIVDGSRDAQQVTELNAQAKKDAEEIEKQRAKIDELMKEHKKFQQQLAEEQAKTKQAQALLQTTLTAVIQDDSQLSTTEKNSILGDFGQQQKFVETVSLKQSLQSQKLSPASSLPEGVVAKTSNLGRGANDITEMVHALQGLPPQALALVALPAALIAAILVLIIK